MNSVQNQVFGQMEPVNFDTPLVEQQADELEQDEVDLKEMLENTKDPF